MNDIIMYLHRLFSITSKECVLRELRCVLVEIQNKTEPVAVKVGPPILSLRNAYRENGDVYSSKFKARLNQMSDIIIYLHYLFSITCGECLLRDLRCVLVEIRSKIAPVAVAYIVVTSGRISPLHNFLCTYIDSSLLLPKNAYYVNCDAYSSKFVARLNRLLLKSFGRSTLLSSPGAHYPHSTISF
ncbi:hypothetical protein V1477_002028 [Vespula maculifrons]|uniref:Uncharacterized protein n=1 Tax=Vespula maculifrons TaxID=7453 RepID=A0ABD2CY09_VESMC